MRRRRRPLRWQDVGEDDQFAGDAYFARWLDEADDRSDGGRDDEAELMPRSRQRYSREIDTPLWWRIWRWWR